MMKRLGFLSESFWCDMDVLFQVRYPSQKELDSCLVSALKVLVGAAKTLTGSNHLIRLQTQALALAKKSGRRCAEWRKLSAAEAIPMLKCQLLRVWDTLACIARRMPTTSLADRKLRFLVLRTAEEVGEYVGKGTVSLG